MAGNEILKYVDAEGLVLVMLVLRITRHYIINSGNSVDDLVSTGQ